MARYAPNTPGGALAGNLDLGLEEQMDPTAGMAPWELFDYLLTPRQHQQTTQFAGGSHYGPSREATISPDSIRQASALLDLMATKAREDQGATARQIDINRADAADEAMGRMRGSGRGEMFTTGEGGFSGDTPTRFGAAGSVTPGYRGNAFSGRDPQASQADLMTMAAGGYPATTKPDQSDWDRDRGRIEEQKIAVDRLNQLSTDLEAAMMRGDAELAKNIKAEMSFWESKVGYSGAAGQTPTPGGPQGPPRVPGPGPAASPAQTTNAAAPTPTPGPQANNWQDFTAGGGRQQRFVQQPDGTWVMLQE
jgi:hypothetical protein